MTALIYVVIIVALLTYFTMFNINSLAQGFGQIYDSKKKRIVHAMKKDHNESWKLLGQRFEVFRPKHEKPEPSEWYIPLYTLLHPGAVLGLSSSHSSESGGVASTGDRESSSKSPGMIGNLFRKRKSKIIKPEEPEQPWVLGYSR